MSDEAVQKERDRRALWTSLSAVAGRGLGLALSLISLPLTVAYLDTERYGVWVTIGSTISLLTIADLGMGNGLSNAITVARAQGDHVAARRAVANTFLLLAGIALALGIGFAATFPFISWARVLAVSPRVATGELHVTVALCLAFFAFGFPLGIMDRVLGACQEGYRSNLWASVSAVITTVGLIVAVRATSGLPILVVVLSGLPLLVRVALAWWVFFRAHPELRPRRGDYEPEVARRILRTGVAFLIPQVAALAVYQTDNIIISHLFGAAAVGPYAIAYRLATLVTGLFGMWLGPLWAAYADAAARGDFAWFRAKLRRTRRVAPLVAVTWGVTTLLIGQWIIRTWTRKPELAPSRSLLLAMAVYVALSLWNQLHAVALNALNCTRGQIYYGSIGAVINLTMSVVLGRAIGIEGVCWATSSAMLLAAVLGPFELRQALRDAEAGHATAAAETPRDAPA